MLIAPQNPVNLHLTKVNTLQINEEEEEETLHLDWEDEGYCITSLTSLKSHHNLLIHYCLSITPLCAILLNVNTIRSTVCEELHDYSLKKNTDCCINRRACGQKCHVTRSALVQMQLCFRLVSTKKSEHLSIIYQMESFRGKHRLCPASLPSAPINQHHCHWQLDRLQF